MLNFSVNFQDFMGYVTKMVFQNFNFQICKVFLDFNLRMEYFIDDRKTAPVDNRFQNFRKYS